MSFIQTLFTLARDWKIRRDDELDEYLSKIVEFIFCLVQEDEILSDEAKLIRENLRNIYQTVSASLKGRLEEDDIALVLRALSSARIYYWVKVLEGQPVGDLSEFFKLRHDNDELLFESASDDYGEYGPNEISSSLTLAIQMGMAKCPATKRQIIEELKKVCFIDFASLQELQRKIHWKYT